MRWNFVASGVAMAPGRHSASSAPVPGVGPPRCFCWSRCRAVASSQRPCRVTLPSPHWPNAVASACRPRTAAGAGGPSSAAGARWRPAAHPPRLPSAARVPWPIWPCGCAARALGPCKADLCQRPPPRACPLAGRAATPMAWCLAWRWRCWWSSSWLWRCAPRPSLVVSSPARRPGSSLGAFPTRIAIPAGRCLPVGRVLFATGVEGWGMRSW